MNSLFRMKLRPRSNGSAKKRRVPHEDDEEQKPSLEGTLIESAPSSSRSKKIEVTKRTPSESGPNPAPTRLQGISPIHIHGDYPSELFCDIFQALDRDEVEKCQLVSSSFRYLVEGSHPILPLRKYHSLKFRFDHQKPEDGIKGAVNLTSNGANGSKPTLILHGDIYRIKALNTIIFKYLHIEYELNKKTFENYCDKSTYESPWSTMELLQRFVDVCGQPIKAINWYIYPNSAKIYRDLVPNYILLKKISLEIKPEEIGAMKTPSKLNMPSCLTQISLWTNAEIDEEFLLECVKNEDPDSKRIQLDVHMTVDREHFNEGDYWRNRDFYNQKADRFVKKLIQVFTSETNEPEAMPKKISISKYKSGEIFCGNTFDGEEETERKTETKRDDSWTLEAKDTVFHTSIRIHKE